MNAGDTLRALRQLGAVPVLLRGTVLVSCAVATAATIVPAWDVPNGYIILAVVATVVAAIVPDTGAGSCFVVMIGAGWTTGVDRAGIGPAVIVAALALLVGHVAGALAAAMPATAAADVRLALRWWRPTSALAIGTVLAAALIAALDAWDRQGSIVVILAALAAVGTAAWWWSSDEAR